MIAMNTYPFTPQTTILVEAAPIVTINPVVNPTINVSPTPVTVTPTYVFF